MVGGIAESGWGTRIPAQTRIADQKPLACSAFCGATAGRVGALWTIALDHSSCRGIAGTPTPWAARAGATRLHLAEAGR